MERLSSFLVRYRAAMLAVTLIVTAGSAYLASGLKIYDDPNRWPPDDDPSVELNEELQRKFGGANLVTIMICAQGWREHRTGGHTGKSKENYRPARGGAWCNSLCNPLTFHY